MKLIKPSVELIWVTPDPLGVIEKAGRTCYKSEDKITDNSALKFAQMLINRGHEAMIEHASMSMRFICDRGVTHEIVRHRLFSYAQECVSGNTKINKKLTIKQLYDRQHNSRYGKTHNKTLKIKSVDNTGKIIKNNITHVFYKGQQAVYEIKTSLGYTIKCTMQHRFLLPDNSYSALADLRVNDNVMVNGRPKLYQIDSTQLKEAYINDGLCPTEIAEKFSVSYRYVINSLKNAGIFTKHKNDKNKEKYNKNHTSESYKKMGLSIKQGYTNGRTVWNKGLKEDNNASVKKQAEALRKYHHNNGSKENNSNWLHGPITYAKANEIKASITQCELCGSIDNLEVHHIDENIDNNAEANLIKVCCKCHNLLHHGWYVGTQAVKDTIVSITYSGIEDVYDLEMKAPYHNYVANGFITHNSTRYCNYKGGVEFIIPNWVQEIAPDEYEIAWKDKLGSCISDPDMDAEPYDKETKPERRWFWHLALAERDYIRLLIEGWQPQQARSVLPNSLKTEIVITGNLREWKHFFKLRCDTKAHPQMQEVANMALAIAQFEIPVVFDNE